MARYETYDVGLKPGVSDASQIGTQPTAAGKNDNNRADFRVAAYGAMQHAWRIVTAVWLGTLEMRACAREYLPQEPAEDDDSYRPRLQRAVFFNAFRRAVQAMVGMIFRKELSLGADVPADIKQHAEDIDLAGSALPVFAK